MKKTALGVKDLINVGIFTTLYFIVLFMGGMVGYVPIFYAILPFILPILCGIPFMLFLTKVHCFGMVTLMGTICGGLMVLTGHTFIPLLTGFSFGLLADLVFRAGRYQSVKASVLGYMVFSLWIMGMLMPFWFMKDSFENLMRTSMGAEYSDTVMALFQKISWSFPLMALAGGLLGGFLGLSILKKHFRRAGIA